MSDLLELTAAQAAERVRAGDVSAAELFELYRERARGDDLGAYLWVTDDGPPETRSDAPLGGVRQRPLNRDVQEGVDAAALGDALLVPGPVDLRDAVEVRLGHLHGGDVPRGEAGGEVGGGEPGEIVVGSVHALSPPRGCAGPGTAARRPRARRRAPRRRAGTAWARRAG